MAEPDLLNLIRRTANGDGKGNFRFTGLAPGEYRIVALRSVDEDRNRQTGALERALASAGKVELGPHGFLDITLEPVELR